MLNTSLTVRSGAAASHQGKGWETFTDEVLRTVNAKPHRVVFILWGAHARKKKALIDLSRHTVIESAHPSPLSAHNGFFGSKPVQPHQQPRWSRRLDPVDRSRHLGPPDANPSSRSPVVPRSTVRAAGAVGATCWARTRPEHGTRLGGATGDR